MARKVSKRKRPEKEDYLLTERKKLEDLVFDEYTLKTLARMMVKGIFETVDYPVATGKEANVYRATTPEGDFVAIKIYRVETTHFFKKIKYIEGDPRFDKIKKDRKNLAFSFAKKEFKNLMICREAGVSVAKPIAVERNVLVMEFLGEEGLPYPVLNKVKIQESFLEDILEEIRKMYRAGLVHSDLSEYNVLAGKKPLIIDLAQGVVKGHPCFGEFLERDIYNILKYFKSERDPKEVLEWIKG